VIEVASEGDVVIVQVNANYSGAALATAQAALDAYRAQAGITVPIVLVPGGQ
jgi:hypothetical protein